MSVTGGIMVRPKRCRKISGVPEYNTFVPDGIPQNDSILLALDEFEVIRLIDYKSYTHAQCAQQMNISRTTVTEIYAKARKKIALSLMEGYPLKIEQMDLGGQDLVIPALKEKGDYIMRIAVTYENGSIFQHFGQTAQFKYYDVENNEVKESQVIDTRGHSHGALAIVLSSLNVDVLICGGIGKGALMALSGAHIQVIGGITGDCDKAVQAYLDGTLKSEGIPSCDHGKCECHHE